MPPGKEKKEKKPKDTKGVISDLIHKNKIVIFSKSTCPFCESVKDLFMSMDVEYKVVELDEEEKGVEMQDTLYEMSDQRTLPNVFINARHIGGCDKTVQLHMENRLMNIISPPIENYDYDVVVIGGGSGGLAASKECASHGLKTAVLDFVKPSPMGNTWGLGGTCVNVGCVPKKLCHQAAILRHCIDDARRYGWHLGDDIQHNWEKLIESLQDYIGSLNWNYRVQLRSKNVTYLNSFGTIIDHHKIKTTNKKKKSTNITADKIILAMGMRPKYPDIPGAKEYCITSDDLFSLPYSPGKTLSIGASYVALECAGFLQALGLDVTVMVRSILLRGFDQQMAEKIGEYMENHGTKFQRGCVPIKIEQIAEGTPPTLKVTAKTIDGEIFTEEYNTVFLAIGRDPCTKGIGLEKVGVTVNKNGMITVNDMEQTNIPYIYAIGDICEGKPELTPMAIQAGRLLARRLAGVSSDLTDYINVPTTVFTPLEYGACGYSEEDALIKYGDSAIEVYHTYFWPLEWTVAKREENVCYAKMIVLTPENDRVIGLHVCGPNAGEITQGFAVAMKLNATKADFDNTIGIHPTTAEIFTMMSITKRSGEDITQAGC